MANAGTSADAADLFDRAAAADRAGDPVEAERLYARLLAAQPHHVDALYLLAVLKMRRGRPGEALGLINRVVALRPRAPEAHFTRGAVLYGMGRLPQAVANYDKALALRPNYRDALHNRGVALAGLRRFDEAVATYDREIAVAPDYAEAHFARGCALADLGRFADAAASYDRALALDPRHVVACNNRGNALKELGRHAEALASFDRALALRPDFAEAHANRGNVLSELDRFEEAVASYDRALAIRAELPDALSNRAIALQELRRFPEALESFDRALLLLATADGRGAPEQARWLNAAIRFNRARLLLLLGSFAEGWREYEWRRKQRDWPERRFSRPEWTGRDLAGKRVLLYAEAGLGSIIQFARFASSVTRLGGSVALEVPAALARLFERLDPSVTIVRQGEKPPDFDLHLPLLSVPSVLGFDPDRAAPEIPYLSADPVLVEHWAGRLPAGGLRVGIAWQGRPGVPIDKGRSLPARAFAPLGRVPGVALISLQKNAGTEQLAELPAGMNVASLGAELDGGADAFVDTAAIMANLDLIVTSDTSIAHLAGALGRPVWIALRHVPEWRWLLDRDDTPWYPTARLFRQRRAGDWDEVFARIAAELARFPAARPGRGKEAS